MRNKFKQGAINIANEYESFACNTLTPPLHSYLDNFETQLFTAYFKPDEGISTAWYGLRTNENQLASSLALLFMAEIVKEDGL